MRSTIATFLLIFMSTASIAIGQTSADERLQLEAITARLVQVTSADAPPLTPQLAEQRLGEPATKVFRRLSDGTREEELMYVHAEGWTFLTFIDGRFQKAREFATKAVYFDAEPIMKGREAQQILLLSLIDLGWSKEKLQALRIRPKKKFTKEEMEIGADLVKAMTEEIKKADPNGSTEVVAIMEMMSGMTSELLSETWMFETKNYQFSVSFTGNEVSRVLRGRKLSKKAEQVLMSRMVR